MLTLKRLGNEATLSTSLACLIPLWSGMVSMTCELADLAQGYSAWNLGFQRATCGRDTLAWVGLGSTCTESTHTP